jgi:copper(I)-binding protein
MVVIRNFLRAAAFGAALFTSGAGVALADGMEVTGPWTRATVHGASVGVGYLTIENKGTEADRLTSISSDVSDKAELHETRLDGGVMKMRALPQGVEIKAGQSLVLKPGAYHLMLLGLKKQLLPGGAINVTLTFEKAGPVSVAMPIETVGATGPSAAAKPVEEPAKEPAPAVSR